MNHTADRGQKNNYSGEKKRRFFFRRLMSRPFLVLGGATAGIVLLLAVSLYYAYRNTAMPLLSDLITGPKVFRTKIPQEIKIAQNSFRGKIPAVDQPVNISTKIESMPPVEKKAVPPQPTDATPEKSEPLRETEFVQPLESQTKIETTPPVAEEMPSQPTDAASEKSEPLNETEFVQPEESQTEIETTSPVPKAVPSQPIIAPPEQIEPLQKTELVQPVDSPILNETTSPVAKAVPSQPIDAPSEKSETRQEPEPHPPTEPQTKIETIMPAEEQSIYSQPTVAPPEQVELPEKANLRQIEVRPQPIKKDVIKKAEEQIIHNEEWLLSQESSQYTIQLMGARKEALLFSFVARNQLLKQDAIAYYQTTFKDKPWFQLLYGVFATKKEAQTAADNLSPKIRKSSPWIRRLSAVQKAIRKKAAQ